MTNSSTEYWNAFYSALGRLNHSYTSVEVFLAQIIAVLMAAGTHSREHAMMILAMLTGGRMKPLKDAVNRILRAANAPADQRQRVSEVFAQLGHIQFLRDRLAHNETRLVDGAAKPLFESLDSSLSKDPAQLESIIFETNALHAAADDLDQILIFTAVIFEEQLELIGYPPHQDKASTIALDAWQYKPTMLTRCHPKVDRSHLEPFLPGDTPVK